MCFLLFSWNAAASFRTAASVTSLDCSTHLEQTMLHQLTGCHTEKNATHTERVIIHVTLIQIKRKFLWAAWNILLLFQHLEPYIASSTSQKRHRNIAKLYKEINSSECKNFHQSCLSLTRVVGSLGPIPAGWMTEKHSGQITRPSLGRHTQPHSHESYT